ncbi:alpha/beta fold hydrolase [Nocardioides sp. NPDC059952]|uniref:alpha/beta fold hydrolase n=1 Tax=Nocardioides sp. NPDC059952 TaxID=3347014 RepID=UPI003656ECAA
MRAREPDADGYVETDGIKVHYEVYGAAREGAGDRTILLMPTWTIIHARFWKVQIGYLARHFRVVTFDGRGNGRSDRPEGAAAYTNEAYASDALAVLDATGTDRAVVVGLSCGVTWGLHLAADHPDRVAGLIAIAAACGFPIVQERDAFVWDARLDTTDGWAKYNRNHWLEGGYDDFLEFFFAKMFPEPHSTKQIEDCIAWAHETTPQVIADSTAARLGCDGVTCASVEEICGRVRCPVLAIHGTDDQIRPVAISERLVELTGGSLMLLEGSGHGPVGRDPVKINHVIKDFADAVHPRPPVSHTWVRASHRPKKVLYLSSPIGLGHARRDVAIAQALRGHHGDIQVDWLAQHPVTRVLEAAGERVHPASGWLANESRHIEEESGEHDLHVFEAIRRMDEILVNNFMVFDDVVREEHYDLVIGDEAWDVDHFLHENPELKRFGYVWLTDFVGFLPMPDDDDRTRIVTADYNAEMVEHVERHPRLRDRAIFVGNPRDVVPGRFGDDLPEISSWTAQHYDFSGYVTGIDPGSIADRARLRAEVGWRPDERVCVATVGGSGVGSDLLRRVEDTYDAARAAVPDLRMIVVTGPRLDTGVVRPRPGLEVLGFVPDLYRLLAACDLALVQGGLTTTMELAAAGTPFIYVPLRHHFEQNIHVRHRLEQYGAGRCLEYDSLTPDTLARAIADEIGRGTLSRPVEADGADRAAALIADLL